MSKHCGARTLACRVATPRDARSTHTLAKWAEKARVPEASRGVATAATLLRCATQAAMTLHRRSRTSEAHELQQLGAISDFPLPAVTRVVFTPADLRAREYVGGLCAEAGLEIRADAVGNTLRAR